MAEAAVAVSEFEALRERVAHLERRVTTLARARPEEVAVRPDVSRAKRVPWEIDRELLQPLIDRVMEEMGITGELTLTPEQIRQRMIEHGVDPNECIASREIIAAREGEW